MTGETIIVFVTVGSEEEAVKIARTVVEEELAACGNILSRIRSIYRWKGEVHDEPECLMVIKTRAGLFPALRARVRELHSYEVPEIISFPIADGLPEYLDWITEMTREPA